MKRFEPSGCVYRDATNDTDRRLAMRLWLTAALELAQEMNENVAPALALIKALEDLEFGHVASIFKLSGPRGAGAHEDPPSVVGAKAIALAAIDTLIAKGAEAGNAVKVVELALPEFSGKLTNLRKKVIAERGKRSEFRTKYKSLILAYDIEMNAFQSWPPDQIIRSLEAVGRAFGSK